jgi:hypothetical protein
MAVTKPSKHPARPTKGISASSLPPVPFKQSVEFAAAMLSLDRLSRSEPHSGRSKPRREWKRWNADAEKRAMKALLKVKPEGSREALLKNFLVLGRHVMRVGTFYQAMGAPRLKRSHPAAFVAAILRPWPRTGGGAR